MGGALAAAVAGGVVASTPASAATHTTHPAHTARAAFTAPAAPAAPAVHPAPAARAAHPAEAARPAAAPASRRVRTLPVSHGVVDGTAWSVSLEYYAYVPAGYDADPDRTITGVVCQRMYIGGVRVDHQGGPWSDCWGVTGPGDTYGNGSTGLWGFQDKGLSGSTTAPCCATASPRWRTPSSAAGRWRSRTVGSSSPSTRTTRPAS
jgi:hypothetical protein